MENALIALAPGGLRAGHAFASVYKEVIGQADGALPAARPVESRSA